MDAPEDPPASPHPSAVAIDQAADAAGSPRPTEPAPPPPGTVVEKWWQKSAVQLAIGATIVDVGFLFVDAVILGNPLDRAVLAVQVKGTIILWLGALGLWTAGPRKLREK